MARKAVWRLITAALVFAFTTYTQNRALAGEAGKSVMAEVIAVPAAGDPDLQGGGTPWRWLAWSAGWMLVPSDPRAVPLESGEPDVPIGGRVVSSIGSPCSAPLRRSPAGPGRAAKSVPGDHSRAGYAIARSGVAGGRASR